MGGIYASVHVRTSRLDQAVEAARAIAEKTSTKFLKILKDIAAATLRSRIESLKAAGLLLNIDSRPGKQNRWTPVWTPDLSDGYLAYWVDGNPSGIADPVVYSASGDVIRAASGLSLEQSAHTLALSRSGRFLGVMHAFGTAEARLYDWQAHRLLRTVIQNAGLPNLAFSADESVMVTSSENEVTIIPADPSQPEAKINIGLAGLISAIAVHPHQPYVVASYDAGEVAVIDISRLVTMPRATAQTEPFDVWLAKTQRGIGPTGYRPNEIVRALTFSPDGGLLFAGVLEGIRVYNWDEVLSSEKTLPRPVASAKNELVTTSSRTRFQSTHCLAFDSDRNLVLFAGLEGKIGYLDLNNGQAGVLVTLPDEPSIYKMHLSSNKTGLCTASVRNVFDRGRSVELHLWDYQRLLDKSFSKVVSLF